MSGLSRVACIIVPSYQFALTTNEAFEERIPMYITFAVKYISGIYGNDNTICAYNFGYQTLPSLPSVTSKQAQVKRS